MSPRFHTSNVQLPYSMPYSSSGMARCMAILRENTRQNGKRESPDVLQDNASFCAKNTSAFEVSTEQFTCSGNPYQVHIRRWSDKALQEPGHIPCMFVEKRMMTTGSDSARTVMVLAQLAMISGFESARAVIFLTSEAWQSKFATSLRHSGSGQASFQRA